jgi:Methane oxygenase PmoA
VRIKSLVTTKARSVSGPRGIVVQGVLLLGALCLSLLPKGSYLGAQTAAHSTPKEVVSTKNLLRIEQDDQTRVIKVYRDDGKTPILTENAYDDTRPYIHPVAAPDGKGVLTEFRPGHHPHQMGIFWGFKLVNGRDFFMRWQNDHYRKVSASVIEQQGQQVKWQTVYDMLDETGSTVMTETQVWSMQAIDGKYILDLEWKGLAQTGIAFGQYYVGGLFVRMPWHTGDLAEAVNSKGQRNKDAEAQRAKWVDLGIRVDGRNDLAHLAILDSPNNTGFPVSWRVDDQFGFGPDRSWQAWKMEKGQTEVLRYRLIAYTGEFNAAAIEDASKEFATGK